MDREQNKQALKQIFLDQTNVILLASLWSRVQYSTTKVSLISSIHIHLNRVFFDQTKGRI